MPECPKSKDTIIDPHTHVSWVVLNKPAIWELGDDNTWTVTLQAKKAW